MSRRFVRAAWSIAVVVLLGACGYCTDSPPTHVDHTTIGGLANGVLTPATDDSRYAEAAWSIGHPQMLLGDTHRPRRCIALWGQSNAAGRKFIEQVSAPQHDILAASFSNVPLSEWESAFTSPFSVMYDTETQTGSQTPVRATGPLAPRPYALPTANLGPELSFGHGIDAYAPNQFGIIKCTVGGTTMYTEWCPSCSYPSSGPNLFAKCVAQTRAAATAMGCHVAALAFIQGESDACSSTKADAYETGLTAFVSAVRSEWSGLPIVIGRLASNYNSCGSTPTTVSTIRAAEENVVAATTGSAWVNQDGLTLDSGVHFVPDSYVTLGYRYPASILNAMGYALAPSPEFSVTAQDLTAHFTDLSVDLNTGSQANPAIGGSISSWEWDFGDSSTSTSQNPNHTYAADGAYTVSLVAGNGISKARVTQTVTVASPTWTTDATSGVGFPSTSGEWSSFETAHSLTAFSTPSDLYLDQQASGTITDVIGSKNLNVAGSPTYQKTITGWSRKAIGGSGATASQNQNNITYTNLSSASWMVLAYVRHDVSTGSNRPILSLGASGVVELETAGSTTAIRLRTGASGKNGTLAHAGSTVHPYVLLYDKTNQRSCVFSDIEKICSTSWVSGSGATMTGTFSTTSDGTFADFLGVARWEGSAAERSDVEICHLQRALGWNPSGFACH